MEPRLYVEKTKNSLTEIYYLPNDNLGEPTRSSIINYEWHRLDGPAYVAYWEGVTWRETWWQHGLRHRLDGQPASIDHRANVLEWIVGGANVTSEALKWFEENEISNPDFMTDNEKILFNLRFGRS